MFSSLLADSTQPVWDAPEWYPVLFDSPKNIAGSVFFCLTIALVLAFVVCAVLIKGDVRKKFLKGALIAAIVYACAVGITMLALSFAEDGIVEMLFAPLIARVFGGLGPLSAAGAASDTCLPAIIRTSGERNTILGIFSGMVLTVAVPFFVTGIFAWM